MKGRECNADINQVLMAPYGCRPAALLLSYMLLLSPDSIRKPHTHHPAPL